MRLLAIPLTSDLALFTFLQPPYACLSVDVDRHTWFKSLAMLLDASLVISVVNSTLLGSIIDTFCYYPLSLTGVEGCSSVR